MTNWLDAHRCLSARSMVPMSSRLDKSWMVLASYQTDEANRCVDIFRAPTEPTASRSSAEIPRTWVLDTGQLLLGS